MKKLSIIFCLISLSIASTCSAITWHKAAATGNLEELERLIQKEPKNINTCDVVGNTPLHAAIFSNSEPTLRILLKNGALAVLDKSNMNDCTPLILAIQHGMNTAISILLEHGALVNKPDNYDTTPLHWAATCSNLAAVRILLENGALAVINNPNKNGITPLDRARMYNIYGREKEVQAVIELLKYK